MTWLSNSYWLSLSWETRLKLIDLFGMQRTRSSAVSGGKVDADGYQDELGKVSLEAMQKYLGSDESDFYKLLGMTIERLNGHYPDPTWVEPKKRGRPKKA